MIQDRFLRSDEISIVGHKKMRTALGFDIMYVDHNKKAEKIGKIAILFINKHYQTFALLKGGEEYGSFG